ncbi:MAG: heparan-alpha-glucosaminide N-acetyltransferase domain-containing protein [Bacteroidota bacterium]|nr:DUF1624 domain-containing protein [Candidatus Kapabacteria bacterium]MDW8220550.1 heparan-alpha-glucosaminide N-acetyltransferase domain-containing protein [Bacteroidota bacterium]
MSARSVRNDRLYLLDFIRLVAMVMMMQGHTIDAMVSLQYVNFAEVPWTIWHFLRGLTAPTFLMISGAVQLFATAREENGKVPLHVLKKRIEWGIMLIAIGYLLVFPANRIFDLPFVSSDGWRAFFQTNILHVSGATLIATVILMYITRSNRGFAFCSLSLATCIVICSPFADMINWFAFMPEWLGAYFSFKHGSLFTLIPYSAYMFVGVGVGALLYEAPAERREQWLSTYGISIGVALLGLGIAGTYAPLTLYPQHDYYLTSPHFVCIRTGCVLVIMGILAYLYRYVRRFEEYYARLGKKSLYIYTTHLIILFGTPWCKGIAQGDTYRSLTVSEGIIIAVGVIGITLLSAYVIDYFQHHSIPIRKGIRFSLTAVLLYVLLV